jgi:hypothetical protein
VIPSAQDKNQMKSLKEPTKKNKQKKNNIITSAPLEFNLESLEIGFIFNYLDKTLERKEDKKYRNMIRLS